MLCVTTSNYLRHEADAGRVSAESVSKVCTVWANRNRPRVVEFQFDLLTQRELVLDNIKTLKFHGEAGVDPLVLNTTMYAWRTMAKEMAIRTFCAPDNMVRKHMHDSHKVLEMLGAPPVTSLAFQELQLKTLARINETVKRREERRLQTAKQMEGRRGGGSNPRTGIGMARSESVGELSSHPWKTSRDEEEQMFTHARQGYLRGEDYRGPKYSQTLG